MSLRPILPPARDVVRRQCRLDMLARPCPKLVSAMARPTSSLAAYRIGGCKIRVGAVAKWMLKLYADDHAPSPLHICVIFDESARRTAKPLF